MTAEVAEFEESGFKIYRPQCEFCKWKGPKTSMRDWAISHMTVHNNMYHQGW